MANTKIADKPTLDQVKTNTETTNTKIGNTADSGASASTGSVNGKLNKLITDASTNMGYVMAAENCTATISTSSFTVPASSTKIQKVASFTAPHAGKGRVAVALDGMTGSGMTVTVYVSTTSTTSPSQATLEATKKGVSETYSASPNINSYRSAVPLIETTDLTANTTYYIHVVAVNNYTEEIPVETKSVCASVSYTTTTPCQTIIKSIQTGSTNGSEVTIKPVVPEKCVLLVSGETDTSITGWVTATKLLLFINANYNQRINSNKCVWQLIEFY